MPVSIEFDVCIVLSGPEPQRTILENILLKQVVSVHKKVVLVRGLPGKEEIIAAPFNTIIHNYLTETELLNIIVRSNLVICRSGYTTVMEMMYLQKQNHPHSYAGANRTGVPCRTFEQTKFLRNLFTASICF